MGIKVISPITGYSRWRLLGFTGSMHDFIDWLCLPDSSVILHGEGGTLLDEMERLSSLVVKGICFRDSIGSYGALPTAGVSVGDAYLVVSDGLLYIYGESGFPAEGMGVTYRGEPGARGTDGLSAYEIWRDLPGNEGKSVNDFFESMSGGGTLDLSGLSGDVVKATLDTLSPFKDMTVNQYADLAPGAWVGSWAQFLGVEASPKTAGTYFVLD